jgi:hypothetical protein
MQDITGFEEPMQELRNRANDARLWAAAIRPLGSIPRDPRLRFNSSILYPRLVHPWRGPGSEFFCE